MTRPTTSSRIAALESTTPKRVCANPLVASTVRVVPKLVEQSAAPAAKHCKELAPAIPRRENDRVIGKLMPVKATAHDNGRLERRDG